MFATPLKLSSGVNVTLPAASTAYTPTPKISNGVVELPVFAGFEGSINTIVEATTLPSSVSFPPIAFTIIAVSSNVVFPVSFTATGASFTEITSISKVLVTVSTVPSVIV